MTVGVLILAVVGAPASSAAPPLTCGSVVTTNVALDSDLTCPSGDGLIVGASGIVVDLKGHTITGGGPYAGAAGIRVYQHSQVEIRNGTVSSFGNGARLDTNSGNRLWNLTLTNNFRAVDIANSNNNLVEQNRIQGSKTDSVRVGGVSTGNVIRRNTLTDNVFGIGVADDSSSTLVGQNSISGSVDWGVAVFGNASTATVSRNVVSGSLYDGIRVQRPGTQVVQNVVTGNGDDGLEVTDTSVIRSNRATYNGDYGIYAPAGQDAGGNVAYGNGNPAQCVGVVWASS